MPWRPFAWRGRPARPMIACRPDARATRERTLYREKCMAWKGNSSRRWVHGEAQSLSELALQVPEPAVGGGSGEARASLTPTSSFPSCRRQVSIGKRRTRRRRSCAKGHRTPSDQTANRRYGRRKRRSVKRGQSVSGGERHPLLRFQHYFQPPTQPEATVASNGLTGAIYAGGQKVDYVAVADAELAPLILALGRCCENGSSYRSISPTRRPLAARHALRTGGPRQLYRSSAPTGEQMDIE